MQPIDIRVSIESANEAGKIQVKHDAPSDLPLHQNQRRQPEGSRQRSLVVVELGGQQHSLLIVLKSPARYSKYGCADAAPGNFIRVARMPGF